MAMFISISLKVQNKEQKDYIIAIATGIVLKLYQGAPFSLLPIHIIFYSNSSISYNSFLPYAPQRKLKSYL